MTWGRRFNHAALGFALAVAAFSSSQAQAAAPSTAVLFEGVRVFNGRAATLSAPSNVLVGNVINAIQCAIAEPPGTAATRTKGGGRTLMPG